MRILAIQNCAAEGFGSYAGLLVSEGAALEVVHPYRGDLLPPPRGWDAVLVGGTPISVLEAERHAFLREESRFLSEAVRRDVPCLGICAGGQLLAQILGARVSRNPTKEIGGYEVRLTQAGSADALFRGFPARFPVFHWHGDTFAVPVGGDRLVEGEACQNQAFRAGRVVGLQFHLETGRAEAEAWARLYADELAAFGKTTDAVVAECAGSEPERTRLAESLVRNFIESLGTG